MHTNTWLNHPILGREFIGRLRSWKTTSAIVLLTVVASALVLMRWPSESSIDLLSQGAMQVFRPLALTLVIALMMLVPAFPATAIVGERKNGTLTLLLNSPTRPWQIYLEKLSGNVLVALVMISVSIPPLAACFGMGGISLVDHVLPLLLLLVGMSIQYSALGLWVSSRSNSTDASLRWTYAAVLALAVLSLGPTVFVGKLGGVKAMIATWLTTLSPFSALQQIVGAQAQAEQIGISTGWAEYLFTSVILTLLLSIATWIRLDPLLHDRARPVGKVIGQAQANSWLRRLTYLVDPERRQPGIPWWLNPVMVKEFRTRKFGRLHWLIRLISICAIVSLSLVVVAATGTVSWGVEKIAATMVMMQIALLLLIGPALGANLFASEVETGGWQLLRVTPFSSLRITSGKLLSTLWTLLLMLLATLPGYLVMSYIQPAMSGMVGNVVVSLLIAICMVASISACISAFSRATAVATATSYGVLLALFIGTLLIWASRGKPFGAVFVERALRLNPAAAALAEMKTAGFEAYELTPACWYWSSGICVLALVILAVRVWTMTRPD